MNARKRRKRIAVVVPSLEEGGGVAVAAAFVVRVAETRMDAHVDLVSMPHSRNNPASRRLLDPLRWHSRPSVARRVFEDREVLEVGGSLAELEPIRYLSNGLRRAFLADYDLIQVVSGTPAWANAVLGSGPPVALHAATLTRVERGRVGRYGSLARLVVQNAFRPVVNALDRRALMRVDHTFVMNRWMYAHAIAMRGTDAVSLAPPGTDTEVFTPSGERRAGEYLLAVARWSDYRKRLDVTLRAYAALRDRIPDVPPLVLVGKSPPLAEDLRLARELGIDASVRYIGTLSGAELAAAYRGARAFVSTADEEGFGLSILEAMASGCGVVATRCGGPEFSIEDGISGILVARRDPAASAAALARILTDTAFREAVTRAARARVEQLFSVERTSAEFVRVWTRLINRNRPCAVSQD